MSELTVKLADYGCDIDDAMERFLNNEAFYEKCFAKFVEEKSFDELKVHLMANDVRAAFESAHDLKGICANMGVTPMYTLVRDLVEELRVGNMPENALEIQDQLSDMRDELKSFLK